MDTEKYMQEQYDRDVQAVRVQRDSRILMGQQQRAPGPNYMQIFVDTATSYMQMQQTYNAANTYQGKKITNQSVPQNGLNPEANLPPSNSHYWPGGPGI
jgi:hypothetical protein